VIHAVSNSEYRGSFVAPTSGTYVVFSRSSLSAREGRAAGENITRSYPQPVRITVGDSVAPAVRPVRSSSSGVSFLEIGRWILIVLAFLAIFGALVVKHRAVRAALREDAREKRRASDARDHSSAS
jgi:hypothetical protein